jgi:hypothetical protein
MERGHRRRTGKLREGAAKTQGGLGVVGGDWRKRQGRFEQATLLGALGLLRNSWQP